MPKPTRKPTRSRKPATAKLGAILKRLGQVEARVFNLDHRIQLCRLDIVSLADGQDTLEAELSDRIDDAETNASVAATLVKEQVNIIADLERRINAALCRLAARVRELEARLDLHLEDHQKSDGALEAVAATETRPQPSGNPGELPDPLAGCVVVCCDEPLSILVHDPWRFTPDPSIVTPYNGWVQHELVSTSTPTHPAPCRETMVADWKNCEPRMPWGIYASAVYLYVHPLPGDAACLLGEDGVETRTNYSHCRNMRTWMWDSNRLTDFTVPASTTWRPL